MMACPGGGEKRGDVRGACADAADAPGSGEFAERFTGRVSRGSTVVRDVDHRQSSGPFPGRGGRSRGGG